MFSKDDLFDFFGDQTKKIDYRAKLNDEQYEAVMTTEGPLLIIAGAGSGKTTVLTYRLAHLIENGVAPERILLLTFTNKAANEMVSRAKDMLGISCRIQGGTFHSFCAKILRQYHGAVGLSKDFLIKDSSEAADMIDYVKELEGMNKEKDFPNGKELATIFSTAVNKGMPIEKAVSISFQGKYTDYIDEIKKMRGAYAIYKHGRNILDYDDLLLYANKMLRENDNIRSNISDIYQYIMVDEYQDSNMLQFELISLLRSFDNKNICVVGDDQQCIIEGSMIITVDGKVAIENITNESEIIVASGHGTTKKTHPKDISKKQYVGEIIEITTFRGRHISVTPDHTMFAITRRAIKTHDNCDLYLFGGERDDELGWTHKMVVSDENLTNQLNSIDTEDVGVVITEAERAISKGQYRHLSMDKYAELSGKNNVKPFKFILAKDLKVGMSLPVHGDDGKIYTDAITKIERHDYNGFVYDINVDFYMNYIVDDIFVHNCIYGFRGANHKNILNFPKQFESKTIILFRNYRSNQEILDFTNAVAMEAKDRFDKELLGTHSSGRKPIIIHVESDQEQAQAVLYDIIKRHRNGTKYNDMAVLIRSAKDSYALEALITRCMSYNPVPFEKVGGPKFMEQECVRDVLSFMKVLVNEKDEVAWFRVFKMYPNIGPVYGRRLVDGINKDGIESLNDKNHKGKKYGEYLPNIYEWYHELQQKDLSEQIDMVINKYYYEAKTLVIDNKKSKSSVINADRKKLSDDVEEMQILIDATKPYNTASDFLNDITLDATASGERTEDKLTISTVHSAKGLEFNTVYVLSCIEGIFPWTSRGEEGEEERRVFYVATTRAKENLMMFCPDFVFKFGKMVKGEMSEFLKTTRKLCEETSIR